MKKNPGVEKSRLFNDIYQAYCQAESNGVFAPVNFTALADVIQIQILLSPKSDLLCFDIPRKLQRTLIDIARSTKFEFSSTLAVERKKIIVEFDNKKSLDKVINIFEMMRSQNKRAYEAPDLYLGGSELDLNYVQEILEGIFLQVQSA